VWTLKIKSLLPSTANRQAGFTKGRIPLFEKEGVGEIFKIMSSQL